MEEEDDDFYAPNGDAQVKDEDSDIKHEQMDGDHVAQDEDMDAQNQQDEDDDEDDDDDDSDIDIITERQDGAAPEPPPQARPFRSIKPELPRTASVDAPSASPRLQQPKTEPSAAPTQGNKLSISLKDGSKYPEVRSSSIDVNSIPIWSPAGKLLIDVDIDADLAEHTKPWRLPGTDQTDYFNYGFDEFTWTQYCLRQQNMSSAINAQKQETKQFEMMLAGQPGPAGAGPAGPPAMPMGMPGMADMPPDMMNAMFASMSAQGVSDPSQLDFNSFMQQMQSMGGMPGMPGQGGPGPAGGQVGGYGGQAMQQQSSNQGYGSQQHGQQSYPHQQQGGQGFGGGTPQPQSQGQQGGGFEGYSAQQLAMMQGQGGVVPPQGPGGGGRGRGRGRGRHW